MRQLIHEAPTDEKRVDYLNDFANILFDYSLEESNQVVEESLLLANKIGYDYGYGWALIRKGIYYWLSGNPYKAIEVQQRAFQIGRQIKNNGLMAYAKLQNGKTYRDIGFYDSAMNNFEKAEIYQRLESEKDLYAMSMIYTALGNQFTLMEKPEPALTYLKQALRLREELNDKVLIAYTWVDFGNAYRVKNDRTKAKECFAKALSFDSTNIWLQADYAEGIGLMAFADGDFETALRNLSIVIKTYEEYKGKHTLTKVMIDIAEVIEEKGLFDLAHEYLIRALKQAEESGYKLLEAEAHYELAWVELRVNRLNEARVSIAKSREVFTELGNQLRIGGCYNVTGLILFKSKKYDSSLVVQKKGLEIRKSFDNKQAISSSLFNIGDLYLNWGKDEEALRYLLEGIKIDEALGDKYGVSLYQNRIGRIYTRQGKYDEAERYLQQAFDQAKKTTAFDLLRVTYDDYSILYERKGELKRALEFRKLFEQINDSLYNRSSVQSIAAYQTLYDLDVKNREIEILNKDKQLKERELKQRNLMLMVVMAVVLMLGFIVFMLFASRRRMKRLNRDISERNEEIQTQSEELTESNQALLRLNNEIERQREEIKSQAEELMVSNASIAKINEGLEKMVEQRTTDLRTAYQELDTFFYRSSHDFRRPLTTLMGLAEVAKLSLKEPTALDLFEKVNFTARNLDKMLTKLQSISDVGSHQLVFKDVLIRQLIEDSLDPFKAMLLEKQAQISIDINLDRPCVSYPVLIKIAIENVIENAIIFGDPFKPSIAIRVSREGLLIIVEVEDNGEGIHPEVKNHLFEMFYRGSDRSTGNGLGLYIAQKAMEKISGKISFVNNERRPGATFRILIPDLQP